MKNIAKLIETQYDLAYILPIIGEMVDKFVADHLIYIFMKDENGDFRLVWPAKTKRFTRFLKNSPSKSPTEFRRTEKQASGQSETNRTSLAQSPQAAPLKSFAQKTLNISHF